MYLGTEEVRSRAYADDTQKVIDEEVENLLREAERAATALLADHRAALDRLADDLVAHETLDGTAVQAALTGAADPTPPVDSGEPATSGARATDSTCRAESLRNGRAWFLAEHFVDTPTS
jgi:hypothetical protein